MFLDEKLMERVDNYVTTNDPHTVMGTKQLILDLCNITETHESIYVGLSYVDFANIIDRRINSWDIFKTKVKLKYPILAQIISDFSYTFLFFNTDNQQMIDIYKKGKNEKRH